MGRKRQACRSLAVALLVGASVQLLAWVSMISVPISRADNTDEALNALMMGGSGMPTPSTEWQDTVLTD